MTAAVWVPLLISASFFATASYVGVARRKRPTWVMGVILLLACAELTLAQALRTICADLPDKIFWYRMMYFSFNIIPAAFFCLSLEYAGYKSSLTIRNRLILSLFPVITTVLIFTNETHSLFWRSAFTDRIVSSDSFLTAAEAGNWYWAFLFYSYLMMFLGFAVISRMVSRSRKLYGWQSGAFLAAGVLATLGTTLDIFNISPWPSLTATAIGFAFGTITVAWILSRIRRRDLVSVSRTTIINNIGDCIIVMDADRRIVDLNPAAEELLGEKSAQSFGKDIAIFLPALAAPRDSLPSEIGEFTFHSDNVRRVFDFRISAIKDWRESIVSEVIVLRDITDSKRAEEDIRRATENAHVIFWRSPVKKIIRETTGETEFIWKTQYYNLDMVNEFIALRPNPDLDMSKVFYQFVVEEDQAAMYLRSAEALTRGQDGYKQEFRIKDANGAIHWMYENARIQKIDDNRFEVSGFMMEITERKAIENALKESETRLSILFNNDPTCKLIVNRISFIIQDANPSALELIGLPKEAVFGQSCHRFFCSADSQKCPICDLGQTTDNSERILLNGDGIPIPVFRTVVPIKIRGDDYLLESFIDITDRKQAEERILASVAEKEALLKELHHRVKNNMQIISSMIGLQIGQITDEDTIDIFRESQNRIHSMSLIHEKLYRSTNLAHIRFDEYLIDLTNSLASIYSVPSRSVRFQIDAEALFLDIDTAIVCGLIVNELASNSLKHGFPAAAAGLSDAAPGIIAIRLSLSSEQLVRLSIADNGIGFPVDVDYRNTGSLGLLLVSSLTSQLKGEAVFSNQGGARVDVSFQNRKAYIDPS